MKRARTIVLYVLGYAAYCAAVLLAGCSSTGSMLPPPATTTVNVTPTASGYYVTVATSAPAATPTPSPTATATATPAPTPSPSPTPAAIALTTLGDSWMCGVGADPGKDVATDLASLLGAATLTNLCHGGATTDDALRLQVPLVPAASTLVIVQIGFNDERPGADGHDLYIAWQQCILSGYTYSSYCGSAAAPGYSEPTSASSIDGTAYKTSPSAIYARYGAIVAGIKARAPGAKIVLAVPPDADRIPQDLSATNGGPNFPANPSLTANFGWILRTATCPVAGSTATVSTWTMPCSIRDAVQAQAGVTVVNLADAPASLYVSTNFTNDPSTLGHPDDAGAAAIAALLAQGVSR